MAAAPLFGKVEEFDSAHEDWTQYVERLGHFFNANSINDAEKKTSDPSLRDWSFYVQTHEELGSSCKTWREKLRPVGGAANGSLRFAETVQRHKFHSRVRKEGESVATYVSELRLIATFCNFCDSLEDMLQDRLTCRINNDAIQNTLLAKSNLTFKKAMEVAQSLEEVAKRTKELKPVASYKEDVHKVAKRY